MAKKGAFAEFSKKEAAVVRAETIYELLTDFRTTEGKVHPKGVRI